MKAGWRSILVTALVPVFGLPSIPGCALVSPENIEIKKEVLSKIPSDPPRRKMHAATLLVLPPESQPIYDTVQMAYTVTPYELGYFSRHEWAEPPPQMLRALLIKTLEHSHYFNAVVTPPYSTRYSYALRTEILELTQDFTTEPATLRLALHFQLIDGASNRVVATREILMREPMQQKAPEAGVVAANDAIAKALQEVVQFLSDAIH